MALFTLLGIGLVQVYSSSFIFASENYKDGLYFFKRQALFAGLSTGLLLFFAHLRWKWIERIGILMWAAASLGIVLTLIPGLGHRVGGATRWIALPWGFRFEPSELLKISMGLMIGALFFKDNSWLGRWKVPATLLVLFSPIFLLLKQPDFGSFVICISTLLMLLFMFGLKWRYIFASFAVILPSFYILIMQVPYRKARIMAFLDPWSDPAKSGFQVIQSLLGFHMGGIFGVGLGDGQGKLFFLPEAHTDFTLSVWAEEAGFVGVAFVLLLYGFVVTRCLQIATLTVSPLARVVVLALTTVFALQVAINSGVVMGLFPTKGLTLPLMSYGGSSLIMMGIAFGIILNIAKNQTRKTSEGALANE